MMDSVLLVKIVSALCYPLGMASVLLIFWCLSRLLGLIKIGRVCITLALLVLMMASNPLVARWLVASLEDQYPQQRLQDIARHDAILVLGGGLRLPIPPAKHIQLTNGSDRYLHALRLYRAGRAHYIVLTGGNVFHQSGLQGEAYYASKLLQGWGVPSEAIIIEATSRTTVENQRNVLSSLQEQKIKTVLLVTSAYHMPRSHRIFRELPVSITPAPADILLAQDYKPGVFDWIPTVGALYLTTIALHEYYGMAFSNLKAFSLRES